MGYKVLPIDDDEVEKMDFSNGKGGQPSADEHFVWTYTSKEFLMENRLQNFKLPEPVLCIGGIVQIELLGRVQRQEMDGLFYICVAYVQVLARPLSPIFSVNPLEPPGTFLLIFNPEAEFSAPPSIQENPHKISITPEQILNMLRGTLGDEFYDSEDEHHDSEEEMADVFAA